MNTLHPAPPPMASRGSSPQQTTDAIANTASPTATDDGKCREHRLRFLLGLPRLADGALWRTARRLGAPVLISANALSRWTTDAIGLRTWTGFDTRNLRLVHEHPVCLDSAGFVAAARYRGFRGSSTTISTSAPLPRAQLR